jgi:carbon dioxide concentrating mechanism protein CcmO
MPSQSSELSAQSNQQPPPQYHYSDSALGLVATKSFPAIVGTADMMLKSAEVTLVGYEKIGSGHCTAIVRGKTADVRLAVEEGAKTADQFGQLISKLVIPRPMPNLEAVFPIGTRLAELAQQNQGYSRLSNRAIGLLETRGFPAMVAGADAMLKAADVQLASYETIGAGLCTAMIRGSVADVAMAVEVGMEEAERVGELHAVMVIPRLLEDLEKALPVASYWLDQQPERESISLPEKQKETEEQKQPLSLPEKQEEPEKEPVSSEQQQEETEEPEKEPISSEQPQEEMKEPEKEPIAYQKQQEVEKQQEEPEPGLEKEREPLSLEKQQEKSQEKTERQPLSLEKQQEEPEKSEAETEEEEERPLVQLPELEKIDYPQENEEQQQKRQQARPPEEDS